MFKLKKWIPVIVFITIFSLITCSKDKNDNDDSLENNGTTQIISENEIEDEFNYMDVVTIETGQTVVLDDIETFVQISILYNHYNQLWLEEISEKEDYTIDVTEYLANKRKNFYSSLGIDEEEFYEYSREHFQDLSDFLDENEIYNEAYNASQDY